jgi:hypothetical protein
MIHRESDGPSSEEAAVSAGATGGTDSGDEAVKATIRFCRVWLRHFARKFLADGNGYNAAKHGLSIVAGNPSLHSIPTPTPGKGPTPRSSSRDRDPDHRTQRGPR